MINEEKNNVRIYVINSNTGHIVRSESILTNESLTIVAKRYYTKDSIVITLIPYSFYCFYISGESYFCESTKDIEIINFFKDVLSGLYDNARDSFHIEYGRVVTICKFIHTVVPGKYDTLLSCIDNIWETRYYSRLLRRCKND
jgi:hypothetical protein